MMNNGFNREYKRHIKRNIYPVIFYWIVFVMLSVILISLLGMVLTKKEKQYKSIAGKGYDYAIAGIDEQKKENSYFKINSLVTVFANNEVMHTNAYMEIEGVTYNSQGALYTNELKNGEIAISQKLAKRLDVEIGDAIQLELSVYDESKEYVVACFLDYMDDCYDFLDDSSFSVIKLSADSKMMESLRGTSVGFYTSQELDDFLANKGSYSRLYDVKTELELLNRQRIAFYVGITVLWLTFVIIYSKILNKQIYKEAKKYLIDGYSKKDVRLFKQLDTTVFVLSAYLTCMISFLILWLLQMLTPLMVGALAVVSICTGFGLIVKGRKI